MSKWDHMIPFYNGRMLEYTYYDYPTTVDSERGKYGYAPTSWEKAEEFDATLAYVGYHKGRSSVRFQFRDCDRNGREYSMPMSAFNDIVGRMISGVVSGRWRFGKQGQNYGLYPADDAL